MGWRKTKSGWVQTSKNDGKTLGGIPTPANAPGARRKLTPPPPSTIMIRRLAGLDKKQDGVWHFAKGERKTACRSIIPRIYQIETAKLGNIKGKICKVCWPFSI